MKARDKRFCEEYLFDLDAKNAAIRAGFSPSTARNAAAWINPESPGKPEVLERIEELMAQRARRTGVTADRVVLELARIAFANITEVADAEKAAVKDGARRDDTAAIASVKVRSGMDYTEREIKLHDKVRALDLLGRHLGMFTEQVQIQGALPVIIDDSGAEDVLPEERKVGFRTDDGDASP